MTRLTQAELSEPDVTLVMTYAQFDALPRNVYELLRLFPARDDGRRIICTVPAYRYREMEEMGSNADAQAVAS